jgi:site-specific DNA-cytosine methylase
VEGRNPDILVTISIVIPTIRDRIVIVMPCQDDKDRKKQESKGYFNQASSSKNTDEQEQKILGLIDAKIKKNVTCVPSNRKTDRRWMGAHEFSENFAITHAFSSRS